MNVSTTEVKAKSSFGNRVLVSIRRNHPDLHAAHCRGRHLGDLLLFDRRQLPGCSKHFQSFPPDDRDLLPVASAWCW